MQHIIALIFVVPAFLIPYGYCISEWGMWGAVLGLIPCLIITPFVALALPFVVLWWLFSG